MKINRWKPTAEIAVTPETPLAFNEDVFLLTSDNRSELGLLGAMYLASKYFDNKIPCTVERADGSPLFAFDGKSVVGTDEFNKAFANLNWITTDALKIGYGLALTEMEAMTAKIKASSEAG